MTTSDNDRANCRFCFFKHGHAADCPMQDPAAEIMRLRQTREPKKGPGKCPTCGHDPNHFDRSKAAVIVRALDTYLKELVANAIPTRDKPTAHVHGLLKTAFEELVDFDCSFELRWAADMRAIRRWIEEKPGERAMRWPDHADLCVWLLERLEAADKHAEQMADAALRANGEAARLTLELRAALARYPSEPPRDAGL